MRYINTWNAAANQHMIAINEATRVPGGGRWVSWQHEL